MTAIYAIRYLLLSTAMIVEHFKSIVTLPINSRILRQKYVYDISIHNMTSIQLETSVLHIKVLIGYRIEYSLSFQNCNGIQFNLARKNTYYKKFYF